MKTILGVVRASTEHQEIISQKQELSNYIISLGYNDEDIQWLEVAGASARKADKKYLEMLQNIKDAITTCPTIKAAAFWHLNRLGRIDTHLVLMKNWFIENKIQVYIKNPSLQLLNEDGTTNAGGEIAWNVYAAMVKLETDEMFEKVKRGKQRNKAEGIFNGGTIKFGYKLNQDTRKTEINEEEIEILKIIFDEYANNRLSTYFLAEELNARGITQRGKRITAQWLQKILKMEDYKDLVGDVTFNKAQDVLTKRNVNRKTKHIHISGGLVTCPECGGRMFAEMKGYKCYNHYNQNRNETSIECSNTAKINLDVIDNLAFEVAIIGYADFMAVSNRDALEDLKKQIAINRQKLSENQKQLEKFDGRRDRVKKLFIMGDMSEKEYKASKSQIIAEYNDLLSYNLFYHKSITEMESKIYVLGHSTEGDRILKALDEGEFMSVEKAYEIVHRFISNITFNKSDYGKYHIIITTINGFEWHFNYSSYKKSGCKIKVLRNDKMPLNDETDGNDWNVKIRYEHGEICYDTKFI